MCGRTHLWALNSLPFVSGQLRPHAKAAMRNVLGQIFCLFILLRTACPVSAEVFNDSGFVSELVTSFSPYTAIEVAWAPDGRLFIWQKNGIVRIFKNGSLLPTPFLDFSAKVNTYNDNGM